MMAFRLCAFFLYLSMRRGIKMVKAHPLLTWWFGLLFLGGVFVLHWGFAVAISGQEFILELKPEDVLLLFMILFFVKSIADGFHTLVESHGVGFLLSQPISAADMIIARVGASAISHTFLIAIGSGVFVLFDSVSGFIVLSSTPPAAYIELILIAPFASVLGIGTSLEINRSTPLRRPGALIYTVPFAITLLVVHLTIFGYMQTALILVCSAVGLLMLYIRQSVIYEVSTSYLHNKKTLPLPSPFFRVLTPEQQVILKNEWKTFVRSRQMRVTIAVGFSLLLFSIGARFELTSILIRFGAFNQFLAWHFDLLALLILIYFGGMLLGGIPAMEGIILNRRSMWLYRSLPISTEDILISRLRLLAPNMLILMFGISLPSSVIVGLSARESAVLILCSGVLFLVSAGVGQVLGGVFIKSVEEEYESNVLILYTLLMSTLILFGALVMIAGGFFLMDRILGMMVLVLIFDLSFLFPIAGVQISSRLLEKFENV